MTCHRCFPGPCAGRCPAPADEVGCVLDAVAEWQAQVRALNLELADAVKRIGQLEAEWQARGRALDLELADAVKRIKQLERVLQAREAAE